MNIKNIREEITKNKGKNVTGRINVGRNKYEIFEGIISETYPALFTISNGNETKAFCYSDILTQTLLLNYK